MWIDRNKLPEQLRKLHSACSLGQRIDKDHRHAVWNVRSAEGMDTLLQLVGNVLVDEIIETRTDTKVELETRDSVWNVSSVESQDTVLLLVSRIADEMEDYETTDTASGTTVRHVAMESTPESVSSSPMTSRRIAHDVSTVNSLVTMRETVLLLTIELVRHETLLEQRPETASEIDL